MSPQSQTPSAILHQPSAFINVENFLQEVGNCSPSADSGFGVVKLIEDYRGSKATGLGRRVGLKINTVWGLRTADWGTG